MNAEVIKAMNRKNEKHPVRDWWRKIGQNVMIVVLFPIWVPFWVLGWAVDKIKSKMYARIEWSDERANEILSYYVPRYANWDEEAQEFHFFDNGYGWSIHQAKKHLKFKDRRFWNKYRGWGGGEIRQYLLDSFELEGFTKKLGDCSDGWTEISFVKIEEKA